MYSHRNAGSLQVDTGTACFWILGISIQHQEVQYEAAYLLEVCKVLDIAQLWVFGYFAKLAYSYTALR